MNMLNDYLIVEKSALPDYFLKVVEARRLLESGACAQVIDAVHAAGISRSTYYKYKDAIFSPEDMDVGRKAVLEMMLDHTPGVLSTLLTRISSVGASVVTISQTPPIHGLASVTLTLDTSGMSVPMAALMDAIGSAGGVENLKLLAME